MIKILPTGVTNAVEIELSDGIIYEVRELFTGKLTVSVKDEPLGIDRIANRGITLMREKDR